MGWITKEKNRLEEKIVRFLKKRIPTKRMDHILGVIELSEKLALRHHVDPERAKLAASLHDVARCWSHKRLVRYVEKHHLRIPNKRFLCNHQPVLLHSFVGADIARKRFAIYDRQILSAIFKHSLASTQMSKFEKLIYLADLLAPDRKFPEVSRLRDLAFKDLDRAFVEGLRLKMIYCIEKGEPLSPNSVKIWNHFITIPSSPMLDQWRVESR